MSPAASMPTPRERPILFSAPMVRAILDGRKTVTRRIVKWPDVVTHYTSPPLSELTEVRRSRDAADVFVAVWGRHQQAAGFRAAFVVGDRLWVRETWGVLYESTARDDKEAIEAARRGMPWACITYPTRSLHTAAPTRWRPSIHMPRWASRITLAVLGVRVERLQAIDEQDAIAEGVDEVGFPRETFATLWDSINGKRAPWSANPWIWRVEFRRLS